MTQRIFDIENEKDMADLWNILPEEIKKLYHESDCIDEKTANIERFIKINWHDKTEITRPIKEATEADLGKWCCFWDNCCEDIIIGKLTVVDKGHTYYRLGDFATFDHCRRLTKQEIKELC